MGTLDALNIFHPLVGNWFSNSLGFPTRVQRMAWPKIASGENVLITAPTGSGKTLTAFLWAIDRLIQGRLEAGAIRVLYVSPLRALNNDIRRNLSTPLEELRDIFDANGTPMPAIRALTRSGDTPQSERRKMLKNPPEILITTPESLNIMLTSTRGCDLLSNVETVILDEVHAVAGSKRGTHLIAGVERLARQSGEFQRIALSATVRPLEKIAKWVGGYELEKEGAGLYLERPVTIVDAAEKKNYDVRVSYAWSEERIAKTDSSDGNPIWFALAGELADRVSKGNSTLVFANSRRSVERMARLINEDKGERIVYSHHGSLSREIREVVEERLKAGELQGIVATNSLELGIDIGAIDQVLLVETPPSISSTVQRLGRAGHGVGETSRGRIYPIHPQDLVDAAVMTRGVLDGEIEPLFVPRYPLDVLAQEILSMTCTETWDLDGLYEFIRTAEPYHELPRKLFDLLIEMLAGKYGGSRVPELKPRVAIDRITGTIRARPGVARLLYASGGTIPDRGYYSLRLSDSGAKIGELDEEFVWERTVGETISLGVQSWLIEKIGAGDVFVKPNRSRVAMAPFWRCEERFSGFWYANRRSLFLEEADKRLEDPSFKEVLKDEHRFDERTAGELIRFLSNQKKATKCALPHRHHVVVEHVAYPKSSGMRPFSVLHTPWGGRVNRPLALALSAAYEERFHAPLEVMYEDGCVALELTEPTTFEELLDLVPTDQLQRLLRTKLESTGFFGAHFRENAARSLLLLKAGFGKRTPLWLNRQRSKELMEAVSGFEDFPVLLETWRSCMQDEVDTRSLAELLDEVRDGVIEVSQVETSKPSPFASEILWKRTNELMYEDDVPKVEGTKLKSDLISEVVFSSQLRPRISKDVIEELTHKLQRTFPGYAPRDGDDLIEWVKERVIIPIKEWGDLLEAMERDWQIPASEIFPLIGSRVIAINRDPGPKVVLAVEAVSRIFKALSLCEDTKLMSASLDGSSASDEALAAARKITSIESGSKEDGEILLLDLVAEWLRFYGPLSLASLGSTLAIKDEKVTSALSTLADEKRVVVDEITEETTHIEVIDTDNLARLLRMTRARSRPTFEAEPIEKLPLFLACHSDLGASGEVESLEAAVERLFGYCAPASIWEEEIFPARLNNYRTTWLDTLFAGSELIWEGRENRKLLFAFLSDRELFHSENEIEDTQLETLGRLLPEGPGRLSTADLLTAGSFDSAELMSHLWDLAWSGLLTNDTFEAVRQGNISDFKVEVAKRSPKRRPGRKSGFSKWRSERIIAGNWFRLPLVDETGDTVDREELNKDRIRVLLDRYGILFRELLVREEGPLIWGTLFRSLRLMELSGEVVAGQFFQGIRGIQFILPRALLRLRDGNEEQRVFWINAKDPISPCGLGLEGLGLPRRIPSTHLVFHGSKLVLTSFRRGGSLEIGVLPDDDNLPKYLGPLENLLTRDVRPLRGITVEEINGEPAAKSPFRWAFEKTFDTSRDQGSLRIVRRY